MTKKEKIIEILKQRTVSFNHDLIADAILALDKEEWADNEMWKWNMELHKRKVDLFEQKDDEPIKLRDEPIKYRCCDCHKVITE